MVPSLTGVLQGLMMNPVVGVVCPEMRESVLQVFKDVDPPNSRVSAALAKPKASGGSKLPLIWTPEMRPPLY